MCKIEFITNGSNSTLGNFSAGDTARASDALAKHLVEDLGCAVYLDAAGAEGDKTLKGEGDAPPAGKPASDGLNVEQLRAALTAKGVAIPDGAKKAELAVLLDGSAPAA